MLERYALPLVDGRVLATPPTGEPGITNAELLDLIRRGRPAWWADALCREPAYAEVEFFPRRGADARPAKAVCSRCLSRDDCLAAALGNHEIHGIWGGTSERERRQLRRGRAA